MRRRLKNRSVVITGASSGIGRATAIELAKEGAWLTLVARREEPLESLREEVERLGGRALVHRCDVTNPEALRDAARDANATYGGIDAWVNNAGVCVMGELEKTPDDVFRRAMDVNFHGYVYGAKAVLPFFRARNRGVLINVCSVESAVTAPYSTAYASTKFAVRGLTRSLRQELADTGISVCAVLPPSTDTPLHEHTANFTGKKLKAREPVVTPERVAQAIIRCILKPRAEVVVGVQPKLAVMMDSVFPRVTERLMKKSTEAPHVAGEEETPTRGGLYAPVANGDGVRGESKASGQGWFTRSAKTVLMSGLTSAVITILLPAPKRRGIRRLMPSR